MEPGRIKNLQIESSRDSNNVKYNQKESDGQRFFGIFFDFHGFSWISWIFFDFHGFSLIFMDFHWFSLYETLENIVFANEKFSFLYFINCSLFPTGGVWVQPVSFIGVQQHVFRLARPSKSILKRHKTFGILEGGSGMVSYSSIT